MSYEIRSGKIVRLSDEAFVPADETNSDFQQYLNWIQGGNLPVETLSREDAINQTSEAIEQRRLNYVAQGIIWNGYPVQTDPKSLFNLNAEFVAAQSGLRLDGEVWRMTNNENIPLTNNEVIEMFGAVRDHVKVSYGIAWFHKETMSALPTVAEILSYDYSGGW